MQERFTSLTGLLGDSSVRLVFPSEISARFWRHTAVCRRYTEAVTGDRFISWDRFKEQAFGLRESRKPVNGKVRRLFAVHTAQEQRKQPFLTHLLPTDSDSPAGSVNELVRILPRLHSLLPAVQTRNWPLASDIRTLTERYEQFLNGRGLYEPSMLSPSPGEIQETFVLCFPETLEDYPQYREMLKDHPNIHIISAATPPSLSIPSIIMYKTQREEASTLFARIRTLLGDGASPDEIIITCPELEKNRPLLEEYAHHYGIPLRFHSGRKLSEYASVRLFRLISEAVSGFFSMDSMKNLLLNRGIPWRERRKLRQLIQDGVDCYVLRNWQEKGRSHGWTEQLRKGGRNESLELYLRLEGSFQRILSSPDFMETAKQIQAFASTFLDTEQWKEKAPNQLKAFQRALEELNDFAETAAGYPELSPASPFQIWLQTLEDAAYVEQQPARGISVYPYRATAGIAPAWHFIPFLTQDTSRVSWDRGYPLNEAQRVECEIHDDDVSSIYLELYAESGVETVISCAAAGFSGPGLAPGTFVEAGGVIPAEGGMPDADPETEESRYFAEATEPAKKLTPAGWRRKGFGRFLNTGAQPRLKNLLDTSVPHAGLTVSLVEQFTKTGDGGSLSPTDLDAFNCCPFAFLFQRILHLNREEYSPIVRDHRLEGIFLHTVLEAFSDSLGSRPLLSGETETYLESIRNLFDKSSSELSSRPLPIEPAWQASLDMMLQQLLLYPAAEGALFDGFKTVETEKKLKSSIDGIPIGGRVDRVSRGPGGELLIVDYKKNLTLKAADLKPVQGAPASMQIPFYTLLLQACGVSREGDDCITAYYSASKGEFTIVSSSVPLTLPPRKKIILDEDEFAALISLTRHYILTMKKKMDQGDYRSNPEECLSCSLRILCRGKYVIRGER